MTSTVSRSLLVLTAMTLGVVALDPRRDGVLRWVLVGAGVLLLVLGAVARPRRVPAPAAVVTVAGSTTAVLERVCGVGTVGPPVGDGVRDLAPAVVGPAPERPVGSGPAPERPVGSGPELERPAVADPPVEDPDVGAGTPAAIRLDLGRDEGGRRITVPASEGIVVTGPGALAGAIHLALVEQLLDRGGPEDELRCVGVVPRGRSAAPPGRSAAPPGRDDTAGPAGDGCEADDRGLDVAVAVASLVGPDGTVRGVVVRSRDADRPTAAGTVVSVGRTGCRVRIGGADALPFDPALPGHRTEVD